jgi:hypothetical protein
MTATQGKATLRNRVVRECALFCVGTAQDLISTLSRPEHMEQHEGTSILLPAWWYRLYYVFTAASMLIVARLRPDFFDLNDIQRSWDEAMAILHAHEKYGQSARRCIAVLSILSDKIIQDAARNSGTVGEDFERAAEATQGMGQYNQPVPEYSDIDLGGLSFDANGFTWLNTHGWGLFHHGDL